MRLKEYSTDHGMPFYFSVSQYGAILDSGDPQKKELLTGKPILSRRAVLLNANKFQHRNVGSRLPISVSPGGKWEPAAARTYRESRSVREPGSQEKRGRLGP